MDDINRSISTPDRMMFRAVVGRFPVVEAAPVPTTRLERLRERYTPLLDELEYSVERFFAAAAKRIRRR